MLILWLAIGLVPGCAGTTTNLTRVSKTDVAAEAEKERELAITGSWDQQRRLDNVSYQMLVAAHNLCGSDVRPRAGFTSASALSYQKEWQASARQTGVSDSVTIQSVARGSGAERAGVKVGDRIVSVDVATVPTGKDGIKRVSEILQTKATRDGASVSVGIVRNGALQRLDVPLDIACSYGTTVLQSSELNAFADGTTVYVTTAMMRFASDDELATVVAHEISHNAMGHTKKKQQNATVGAIFGAILDVAAAAGGVNTGGANAANFANLAAQKFSQDFEREADYVGMYVLALSSKDLAQAPNLWRRMAQESPGSIKFATSHPTSPERFVRLQQAAQEIAQKEAAGAPLVPELRKR
jgi:membrane-associated protease RseP (regulator of RpoE activity)